MENDNKKQAGFKVQNNDVKNVLVSVNEEAKKKEEQKKEKEAKKSKVAFELQKGKEKEELTIEVIKYDRRIKGLLRELEKSLVEISASKERFRGHRELCSRAELTLRILGGATKYLAQNQIRMFMIDDVEIAEKVKRENNI